MIARIAIVFAAAALGLARADGQSPEGGASRPAGTVRSVELQEQPTAGKSRFERKSPPGFLRLSLCTTAGMAVIFALGVTGLYLNLKYVVAKPISLSHALWIGFVIFIPAEVIKIALSTLVAVKLNRVISA